MTTHRNTEGLAAARERRRIEARSKIKKALREMVRAGLVINPNAVARYAKVARKTIYNHKDLLDEIRAATTTPRPQIADPTPAGAGSSIDAGLRQQLRIQKRQYDTDVAKLRAQIKDLHQQLAVAHGEIHRLRSTQTG
ncbi:DUF6262 family protein [Mycobacterium sp. ML2]